jgi:uncharacterized membrane protein YtjA (UPF0391 family)
MPGSRQDVTPLSQYSSTHYAGLRGRSKRELTRRSPAIPRFIDFRVFFTGKRRYSPTRHAACYCKSAVRSAVARLTDTSEVTIMLYYALVFFIIAIIAAALGFGGIAAGAASIAKVLFFIFLVIFLVTLVMGLMRR